MMFCFLKQYMKLCLVGFSGTIVQFCAFNLFRKWMPISYALCFAIMLAILNNFYLHGRITFQKKNFSLSQIWAREGALFIFYQIGMIYLQVQWLRYSLQCIGPSVAHENLMMFVGMMWGSICNYLVYKYLIWRHI